MVPVWPLDGLIQELFHRNSEGRASGDRNIGKEWEKWPCFILAVIKSRADYGARLVMPDHSKYGLNKTAGRWLVEICYLPEWIEVANSAP